MSSPLFVKWKEEPLSPLSNDEVTWVFEDNLYQQSSLENDVKLEQNDLLLCESKAEVASQLLENLENLIDLDELIKEESFLLDEKMLPILEDVEHHPIELCPQQQHEFIKFEYNDNGNTQSLLNEFETVYDAVEFTHGALTPPQSPPNDQQPQQQQQPLLTTLEPILTETSTSTYVNLDLKQDDQYIVPEKQLLSVLSYRPAIEYPNVSTPQPDIAHELAVVDELVRTRVEDMQWNISSGPSSPNSNSSSSCSNYGDSSSDDPEWMPESVENYNVNQEFTANINTDPLTIKSPITTTRKKGSKPYSRSNQLDKKSRKKEQNKNAATRYRMKKKAEVEVILGEEKILLQQQNELDNKIKDIQREIKYLKGLMRDLFKAKGLIN